ncbi:MAG TPA: T9SS type A sorting domain-containing protein, partial [Flavobacteriales bacterium]
RADWCEVDVNCSEGAGWTSQRDATVRIGVRMGASSYWCTGTLVNNVAMDCKPYYLTAKHCGVNESGMDATTGDYNLWRFYFKYQRTNCNTAGGASTSSSVLGCVERGDSEDGGGFSGSDFLLLEGNTATIPASYNPYWAGWDANNTATTGGKCIHHPAGSEKKISTFTGTTVSTTWGGPSGTHWRVNWVETDNGHGVTEGGSSGSALFNNAHRIVGTLTGGASFCDSPNSPDQYGKMSYHWTNNPNSTNDKLKHWLDPDNTGTLVLDGSYSPCNSTGIGETALNNTFGLQPNPAADRLTLVHPEGAPVERIEILDAAGRSVQTVAPTIGDRTVIDLHERAPGIYLVRVRTGDGTDLVQRLVVQGR